MFYIFCNNLAVAGQGYIFTGKDRTEAEQALDADMYFDRDMITATRVHHPNAVSYYYRQNEVL